MKKFKLLSILVISFGLFGCVKKEPTPEPIPEQKPVESVLNTADDIVEEVPEEPEADTDLDLTADDGSTEDSAEPQASTETETKTEIEPEVNNDGPKIESEPVAVPALDDLPTTKPLKKEEIIVPKTDPISIDDIEIFPPTQEQLDSMQ